MIRTDRWCQTVFQRSCINFLNLPVPGPYWHFPRRSTFSPRPDIFRMFKCCSSYGNNDVHCIVLLTDVSLNKLVIIWSVFGGVCICLLREMLLHGLQQGFKWVVSLINWKSRRYPRFASPESFLQEILFKAIPPGLPFPFSFPLWAFWYTEVFNSETWRFVPWWMFSWPLKRICLDSQERKIIFLYCLPEV